MGRRDKDIITIGKKSINSREGIKMIVAKIIQTDQDLKIRRKPKATTNFLAVSIIKLCPPIHARMSTTELI